MQLLVAAVDGCGFVVDGEEAVAQPAPQVLTPAEGSIKVGDAVALVGDNRGMLVVERAAIPVRSRGRGVIPAALQMRRPGRRQGLPPRRRVKLAGLGEGRTRTEIDLGLWRWSRGGAGRTVPTGFPRPNKFAA